MKRCPGEEACPQWQGAATKTEESVCHGIRCELLPTKPKKAGSANVPALSLINNVFEIRQRRLSGYPAKDWQITNIEFAALIKMDSLFSNFENYLKTEEVKTYKLIQRFLTGEK